MLSQAQLQRTLLGLGLGLVFGSISPALAERQGPDVVGESSSLSLASDADASAVKHSSERQTSTVSQDQAVPASDAGALSTAAADALGDPDQYLPATDPYAVAQLVIDLSDRKVYVHGHNSDAPLMSYPIAVGKDGWETPTGTFEVIQMLKDPAWEHPWNGSVVPAGPGNPLGDRWIGFWTDGRDYIG
ncbi:MAG: L,D-transpeptidase, partial [Cyanobacteria bacterium P01_H01_bin.121]